MSPIPLAQWTRVLVLEGLDSRAGASRDRLCFRNLRHLVPFARRILGAILKTPVHEGPTKSHSVARIVLLYLLDAERRSWDRKREGKATSGSAN
ncbi:hypothetical protein FS749_014990 [Ceratobasidium sp. UAMH 11750]|nr:hypothetical protein FS749_014990 [Ceratobasidium sp. UAMH 11750]